jgi:hypothetical protein
MSAHKKALFFKQGFLFAEAFNGLEPGLTDWR